MLRVPCAMAQKIKDTLSQMGAFDRSRKVLKDGEYVFFPVTGAVRLNGCEIVLSDSPQKEMGAKSLSQALEKVLPPELMACAPVSYSVVGDIAVIELDDSLTDYGQRIGQALMRTFKNIRVVAQKTGIVSGKYRVPELKAIAGEQRTKTIHKENGSRFLVDIAKSYFNPRTATERARIASLAKSNERALVMFAGVGPYAVQLARAGAKVTAVEINPDAVSDMRENARMNRVEMKIIHSDVRKVRLDESSFDRIVMPLPRMSSDYLDIAAAAVKKGGMIHYYTFAPDSSDAVLKFEKRLRELGSNARSVDCIRCGSFSPAISKYCIDASF